MAEKNNQKKSLKILEVTKKRLLLHPLPKTGKHNKKKF